MGYLKSSGKPDEAEKKTALEAVLTKIDKDLEVGDRGRRCKGAGSEVHALFFGCVPWRWRDVVRRHGTGATPRDDATGRHVQAAKPFIHGAAPGTNDFELAPKLRVITVALPALKVGCPAGTRPLGTPAGAGRPVPRLSLPGSAANPVSWSRPGRAAAA